MSEARARPGQIEQHPTERPFTAAELERFARELPDPATSPAETATVRVESAIECYEPPVEIPCDAQGLPPFPPGGFEHVVWVYQFVRRRRPDGAWFWYCKPR